MHNLNIKIKLEFLGADLVIDDADVSLEIKKTDDAKPNYCTITTYNLADDTYIKIRDNVNAVRVYMNRGYSQDTQDNWVLIFQGDLRDLKKWKKATKTSSGNKKKRKKKRASTAVQHYNEPPVRQETNNADIETIIELQDGCKDGTLNFHYSKSYNGQVTNQMILNDCLNYLKSNGITVGRIDSLNSITYPKGKVVQGSVLNVLSSIAINGGCRSSFQNGVFSIINASTSNTPEAIVISGDIALNPEFKTDKEIDVSTPLLPSVNPEDYVYLDFDNVEGFYRIKELVHKVDTFGEEYSTDLTLKY